MKKSLISLESLSDKTLDKILELAVDVKANRAKYSKALDGKTLGLIFEKPSTRTRVSFEVGFNQLGGSSFDFSKPNQRLGERESLRDVARTLSRYLDCLVLRTFAHSTIEEINEYSSMPIINGLSDYVHPCQALADYMTIIEKSNLENKDIKVAYLGDGNNVLNSLMMILARKGVNLSVATPAEYAPDETMVEKAKEYYANTEAQLIIGTSPKEIVQDADYIYTDVWVSMGEENSGKDNAIFRDYQINAELLKYAKQDVKVMHCLPAHIGDEITEDVFESEHSIVFDQAENRLHAQKGVLLYLLKNDEDK